MPLASPVSSQSPRGRHCWLAQCCRSTVGQANRGTRQSGASDYYYTPRGQKWAILPVTTARFGPSSRLVSPGGHAGGTCLQPAWPPGLTGLTSAHAKYKTLAPSPLPPDRFDDQIGHGGRPEMVDREAPGRTAPGRRCRGGSISRRTPSARDRLRGGIAGPWPRCNPAAA